MTRPLLLSAIVLVAAGALGLGAVSVPQSASPGAEVNLSAGGTKVRAVDPGSVYGRIQIVDTFPDYKVKAVNSQAHVKVKIVKTQPGRGEWQIVNTFPDYKIQMVQTFPDFTADFNGDVPAGRGE